MEKYQDIFVKAEVKKQKKGNGLRAALQLINDVNELQAKIEECAEAQDIVENKDKIKAFLPQLDQMYEVLFELARSGVKSIAQEHEEGSVETGSGGADKVVEEERFLTEDDLEQYARKPISVPRPPSM